MKTTAIILLVSLFLLSGCSTKKFTQEEEAYLNSISKKQFNNRFQQSEIKMVWQRAKDFWKPYSPLKRYTSNKYKTEQSYKTEITYVLKRTPLPDNMYRIRISAILNDPLMTETAERNTALFYEYINTGKFKYPNLVVH
ncbi:hypothetical protein MNBD_GAMMA09-2955 [hydrothermal vent metagenome]|uniref:Lipoprotein n=1 Tax=hydrothermal vent metagenome TaxID=652676 RepID=A0A3B0XQ61_9ZZZZ